MQKLAPNGSPQRANDESHFVLVDLKTRLRKPLPTIEIILGATPGDHDVSGSKQLDKEPRLYHEGHQVQQLIIRSDLACEFSVGCHA